MNAADLHPVIPRPTLVDAINKACQAIAPTWPLDRFIAVNPFWGRTDRNFAAVDIELRRLMDSALSMPADYYREVWESGRIHRVHLEAALAELHSPVSVEAAVASLQQPASRMMPLPMLSDSLDAIRDLKHEPAWREVLTHQISQFCAAWFDADQADWRPPHAQHLFAAWREAVEHDHGVTLLMHTHDIAQRARLLPMEPIDMIEQAIARLGCPAEQVEALLEVTLLRMNGWAAWCAYQRWQARLAGQDDDCLIDMLAIRLAWECLLDDGNRDVGSVWHRWQESWHQAWDAPVEDSVRLLAVWQRAEEIAYQQPLLQQLRNKAPVPAAAPTIQAVFCIDVRSEPLRRALEAANPAIQTFGFAGFFGLPVQYTPLGTDAARPQLPGLLAPAIHMTDTCQDPAQEQALCSIRQQRLENKAAQQPFNRLPGSAFTLVESLGIGYLGKLIRRSIGGKAEPAPHLAGLTAQEAEALQPQLQAELPQRVDLAERVLRALGLTQSLARLVVFIGHGSQSSNNPHAAGLDCGACGGQAGDGNARALAALLNDPAVRQALPARGITIPEDTCFLAGLHQTTTDTVRLFDRVGIPASHGALLAQFQQNLQQASRQTRAERSAALELAHLNSSPEGLFRALVARATDWAQTRPEWGLVNNAAMVVAPRHLSRGIDLAGRVFLQDYDWQPDADSSVLAGILNGPVIVAHWINMQYLASMVDNRHFGSGNKLLHNVVGGRIGVFEGNGGDLRIGLPIQSLHDGARWRHTPLRLSVFIQAPRQTLEMALAAAPTVRQLADHAWLYLYRLEGETVECYVRGEWVSC